MIVSWTIFKDHVTSKGLFAQIVIDEDTRYVVVAFDGPLHLECELARDGNENTVDFETNFKNTANKKIGLLTDTENAQVVNPKLAGSGRRYVATFMNFSTSDLSSVVSKEWDQSDTGYASIKLYDASGAEITDNANKGNATTTILTVGNTKDCDIQGFCLYQSAQPTVDVYLYGAIAPHIPKQYGGTVECIQACNLRYANFGNREMDWVGDSASTVKYDPVYFSHLMQLKITHPAGFTHHLQCEVIWYV